MDCDRTVTPYGQSTARILELLGDLGPMARTEICQLLGLTRDEAAAIITRLMRPVLRPLPGPRRVRIADWIDDAEGERRYLRAVYGLGSEPDARKPSMRQRRLQAAVDYRLRVKGRALSTILRGQHANL